MSSQKSQPRKRTYEKRKRADNEAATRLRITEAAVELHGTVGLSRTTISSIAERAGVRRATVYRHFPDELSLFEACSSHWAMQNPPPDPTQWSKVTDPEQRLRTTLNELYAWYERVDYMLINLIRDADKIPPQLDAPRRMYLAAVEDLLTKGWGTRGRRSTRLRAALGLALDFSAWHALHDRGLSRDEVVELMAAPVRDAAGPSSRR